MGGGRKREEVGDLKGAWTEKKEGRLVKIPEKPPRNNEPGREEGL